LFKIQDTNTGEDISMIIIQLMFLRRQITFGESVDSWNIP